MAKNLECLKLQCCSSLTEVPSSVQYLDKLEEIDLYGCYNLRSFPMLDSKVLSFLIISPCLDATTCSPISQNMAWLQLEQTSIKEVPQSVTGRLQYLILDGCSKMIKFPENLEDIEVLKLRGTAIKEVPSSIQYFTRLEALDMSGCSKLESFPEITVPMKSLRSLDLSKTGIKELPLSIKDMVCLRYLALHGTRIKVLPELPPSLETLTTHDCASLETVTSIINIGRLWFGLDFTNCFKLDQKQLIEAMHLKVQSGEEIPYDRIQMVLPGREIPEWFGDKGIGSSLTIQLPSNCLQLKGIAFCLVFQLPLSHDMPITVISGRSDVHVNYDYHVTSKNGEHNGDDEVVFASHKSSLSVDLRTCDSDHMILCYELKLVNQLRKYSGNEITFKFYHVVDIKGIRKVGHEIRRPFKLKSCGVYLHFDENKPTDKKFKRKFWEI
ncbi:hypothetical protein NC652_041052 [Populus alba x Populus x berolinensis]|nr:hypothetical protein NC652_041052 [Populus alba x Populus x berolinensis]